LIGREPLQHCILSSRSKSLQRGCLSLQSRRIGECYRASTCRSLHPGSRQSAVTYSANSPLMAS